jgi:hypothetical protein
MKKRCRLAALPSRTLTAAALGILLVLATTDAFAGQKRGADVVVTMRDGRQASGELIAVKPESILILDPAGKDASFDLSEIVMIRVHRKSKAGTGALTGLAIGAGAGIAGGYISAGTGEDADFKGGMRAMLLGSIGGLVGLIAGSAAGASAGGDLDIRISNDSGASLRGIKKTLRKHARYKESR